MDLSVQGTDLARSASYGVRNLPLRPGKNKEIPRPSGMGPTAHPAKGNTKPYATSRSGNIRKDLTKDKQEKTKKNPSRNPKNKNTKTKKIPEKRPPSALTGERDRTRSHPRGEKRKLVAGRES